MAALSLKRHTFRRGRGRGLGLSPHLRPVRRRPWRRLLEFGRYCVLRKVRLLHWYNFSSLQSLLGFLTFNLDGKNWPITNYFPLGIPTSEINMRCGEGCSCCPLVDTWQCTRSDWLIRDSRDFLPQVCLHLQVRQTHKRLYGTYIIYIT